MPNFPALAIVVNIENTPTRLATKFGVSFARMTPLPSVVTRKRSRASSTSGSDSAQGMISARCM
jgi:hypothetical protein